MNAIFLVSLACLVAACSAQTSPAAPSTPIVNATHTVHHHAIVYEIIAKFDVSLCSSNPSNTTPRVPYDTVCEGGHKAGDEVCICKKPSAEGLKALQAHLVSEGQKELPEKDGWVPRCGNCDTNLKWTPVHVVS